MCKDALHIAIQNNVRYVEDLAIVLRNVSLILLVDLQTCDLRQHK